MRLRLGTRGSRLALIQSGLVAARLRQAGHEVDLVPIVTEGDLRPADMSPGEGVFVGELERALLAGDIELAVHSAKDVPLEESADILIAAYPERADARDALVTREGGRAIGDLPAAATVGTDSPRRTGFVRAIRPDLRVVPLHGNVDTRLRRLDEGTVDALVIAAAGVDRLGLATRIDARLDPGEVAPAPGQGALAVQARSSDVRTVQAVAAIDDPEVRFAVELEREVLKATGGTCRAPVGALAALSDGEFELIVAGVNSDGSGRRVEVIHGDRREAVGLARRAGLRLVAAVALR
ncbi:MAG TPA: hydroxymethylbilane synthase [Candidatus Dormibacteraeota bacterium]|nr:hydroxymethylbilane synthase [Candidatus Dormibacteraeota bacterium]